MPVAAFDIAPDGTATPADLAKPPAHARWVHWDRNDPALADWAETAMPAVAVQALLQAETRPRLLPLDEGLVMILRGVNLNPGQLAEDMVSVRVFMAGGLLVTVRGRRVFALDAVRQEGEAGHLPASAPAILARLIEGLSERIERETEDLEDRVDDIEELMFLDAAHADLDELPRLRRATIRLRRFVAPQAVALEEAAAQVKFDKQVKHSLRDSANRSRRAVELLDAARDRLSAAAEHVELQRSAQLGRNSYVLSIVAAIFLPLGFLTGLFGVNVAGMPGTSDPMAFTVLSVIMVAIGVGVAVVLRWLRLF